ncbi:MAG: hypothetical protein AAF389_19695 [Gemmatimonadota bacterium]
MTHRSRRGGGRSPRWRHDHGRAALALALTLSLGLTADVSGQERGPWWTLWSWDSPHERVIVGMTTAHVYSLDNGFANNWAVGGIVDGYFGATFITTHGPRGWAVGFERAWVEGSKGPLSLMAGFRTGLVYGYDHRLGWLADRVPILPYAQPVFLARAGPVTVDLTYTWVVFSFTGGLTVW